MKFSVGDRVRVIAWTAPGVSTPQARHIACGDTGVILKVRVADANEGADGGYKVNLLSRSVEWWFRACDLVAEDSPCTCDNTIRRMPVAECPVHDRADFDPAADAAAKLQSLVADLEDELECEGCQGSGMYMGGPPDYNDVLCKRCDGTGHR